MKKATYNNQDNLLFQDSLKNKVKYHFAKKNISTKGNWIIVFKGLSFFIMMILGYFIILNSTSFLFLLCGYIIQVFSTVLFVVTVAHDASHKALSKNNFINKSLSLSWALLGMSTYFWEAKHHQSHHNFTNVIGYDQDIEQVSILRMNPEAPYKWYHKYQYIYVFVIYLLFGFFTVTTREFRLYKIRQYGNYYSDHGMKTLLSLIVIKILYFTLNLGLPFYFNNMPLWQLFIAWFIAISFSGAYIALILAIPHINTSTSFEKPAPNGSMNHDWYTHTFMTTSDASPNSILLNWFSGGLNTHVIHHMFPHICHVHYQSLTPIVRQIAIEHNLPYKSCSFLQLIRKHISLLKYLGNQKSL